MLTNGWERSPRIGQSKNGMYIQQDKLKPYTLEPIPLCNSGEVGPPNRGGTQESPAKDVGKVFEGGACLVDRSLPSRNVEEG